MERKWSGALVKTNTSEKQEIPETDVCQTPSDVLQSNTSLRIVGMLSALGERRTINEEFDEQDQVLEFSNEYENVPEIFEKVFRHKKLVISIEELNEVCSFLANNNVRKWLNAIFKKMRLSWKNTSVNNVVSLVEWDLDNADLITKLRNYFQTWKMLDGQTVILPDFDDYEKYDYVQGFDTMDYSIAVEGDDVIIVQLQQDGRLVEWIFMDDFKDSRMNSPFIEHEAIGSKTNDYWLAKVHIPGRWWGVVRVNEDRTAENITGIKYRENDLILRLDWKVYEVKAKGLRKKRIL